MYNMEISIGSYKCRLEICILAFVLFWIMFGHVMCSCCTMSMQEGLAVMKQGFVAAPRARRAANVYDDNNNTEGFVTAPRARRAYNDANNDTEGFVTAPVAKKRVYDNNTTDSTETTETTDTSTSTTTEGFVSSNNKAYGPEFGASKAPGYIMRPDTWAQPTLAYSKGTTPSAGAQEILNRNNRPLAKGQLDFFDNTLFKPECCPNAFSSSMGCACMDMKQYNTLISRGGNNVPYSEY